MDLKYSFRDVIVYMTVGFYAVAIYFFIFPWEFERVFDVFHSGFSSIFIVYPFAYIIGHIVMGIDDFLFNAILYRPLRLKRFKNPSFTNFYQFIFFGNRVLGRKELMNNESVNNFHLTAEKVVIKEGLGNGKYYLMISDLSKGLYLCSLIGLFALFLVMKISFVFILGCIIFWYRGRSFSNKYVNLIIRQAREVS